MRMKKSKAELAKIKDLRAKRRKSRKAVAAKYHVALCERMNEATKGFNIRQVADATGCHPENVRRHLLNGRPPAMFVARLAEEFDVSPSWLLLGQGQMRAKKSKR